MLHMALVAAFALAGCSNGPQGPATPRAVVDQPCRYVFAQQFAVNCAPPISPFDRIPWRPRKRAVRLRTSFGFRLSSP
jgi:hypothetical protein